MAVEIELINGLALGIEYVANPDDGPNEPIGAVVCIHLLCIRICIPVFK